MGGCASDSSNLDSGVTGSLAGSKWHYSDNDWQYDIEFRSNGALYSSHPNDKSKDNDSWEQEGNTVRFYYNNKFSSYTGSLSGNNLMSGTATNKNGVKWNWKATRAD
jgi:hypothetical protein